MEEQSYNSFYQNSLDDYSWKPEYNYNPLYEWSYEEEDLRFNHKSCDDYSWKLEYDYNPLYEWNCEKEDPSYSYNSQHPYNSSLSDTIVELQASMAINCEMMKDLLAELKQINSHVNGFPPQPVSKALISSATLHNFDEVSVTSTSSGENFEESTLLSTYEGYHTDVVPTLFVKEDDITTIRNEALSHSTILPLILDEKKCYHTDFQVMEKEPTSIVNVPVDMVDTEKEKLLQTDSAMEMEMLELFEDITLEDVVLNKACVGKVMGCKDMPASVVKKILMGIWRNVGGWRMKKCGEGISGFFFDTEEDCKFTMGKRPWLVNRMLLNLKPWPVEGEVRVADFEVARVWVQFHGLPTRCLSNENVVIIAKKVGQFVKTDDKSKVELPSENALIDWKTEKKGTWRRRHSRKPVGEDDSTLACKKDSESVSTLSRCVEASSSEKDRDRASDSGTNTEKVVFDRMVGNFGYVREPIPIGPNYLDLSTPDFANAGEGKIPDTGPTLAQSLEIPHSWVCASQRPHNYPDEVPIKWPTNDLEMQKAFMTLYGREVTNKFQAQQTLIANPPDLSELINHLLETHQRKAQTWYIPVPSHPHCSIDNLIENEIPPPSEIEKQLSVDTEASFSMGSFEQGESWKSKVRRKVASNERRDAATGTLGAPHMEDHIKALEQATGDMQAAITVLKNGQAALQDSLNDTIKDCNVSVTAIREELAGMSTRLNLTMIAAERANTGGHGGKLWPSKSGGADKRTPESGSSSKSDATTGKKPLKCWLCQGPHRAAACPHQSKLSAIKASIAQEEQG
ncbi:hypothetical protein G4B88_024761, partial [Cannabis sativa]